MFSRELVDAVRSCCCDGSKAKVKDCRRYKPLLSCQVVLSLKSVFYKYVAKVPQTLFFSLSLWVVQRRNEVVILLLPRYYIGLLVLMSLS